MNQSELVNKIGDMLTGWSLDKKHAEMLCAIVLPVVIEAGVELRCNRAA